LLDAALGADGSDGRRWCGKVWLVWLVGTGTRCFDGVGRRPAGGGCWPADTAYGTGARVTVTTTHLLGAYSSRPGLPVGPFTPAAGRARALPGTSGGVRRSTRPRTC
jgi:hypothetical protein